MFNARIHSVYWITTLILVLILSVHFFFQLKSSQQLLRDMIHSQAVSHVSILARGSVDDLLAKDYGDLEQWVRQAAAPPEYAFVYILSDKGKILLHSDLGYAGVTRAVSRTESTLHRQILYESQPAIEIIYPIYIEDVLLGTAHLAYYVDKIEARVKQHSQRLTFIYLFFSICVLCLTILAIRYSLNHSIRSS